MTMTQATAADLRHHPAWLQIKAAATALQPLQSKNGSIEDVAHHDAARGHVDRLVQGIRDMAPEFPHDAAYLAQAVVDFERWVAEGFGVPDFFDALVEFQPQQHRIDGLQHLVVFPMVTQNGSSDRLVEAVLVEVIWPEFVAELEAGRFPWVQPWSNAAASPGLPRNAARNLDTWVCNCSRAESVGSPSPSSSISVGASSAHCRSSASTASRCLRSETMLVPNICQPT